ncbi:recombinase XerD [bacterium]|nr:recombinase XerD [bacterium]
MSNTPPKYRLHKPTGQALVEIQGRRFYLGKHGTEESRHKYQRVIAEWAQCQLHPATNSKASEPLGISINRLILLYYRHAQTYYVGPDQKPTSEVTNIKYSLKPLKELYGHTSVNLFGPKCLKAIQAHMVSLGWSRKLINSRINHIRRAVKWGVSEELVPSSVLEGLRAVQGLRRGRTLAHETAPVRAVPDAHVDPVLPCVAPPVAAMIQLQRLSGMRPGEVVMMRSCEIDKTDDVWIYSPPQHKTAYHGHRREIHLGPKSQQILKPFMESKDPEAFLFSPKDAEQQRNAARRLARQSRAD